MYPDGPVASQSCVPDGPVACVGVRNAGGVHSHTEDHSKPDLRVPGPPTTAPQVQTGLYPVRVRVYVCGCVCV